jgi:hypothetical protein
MLPLLVVALVVPAFLGFALGGTAAGTSIGALTIAILVVVAARSRHRTPIHFAEQVAAAPVVVLVLTSIEDSRAAGGLAALAEAHAGDRGPHEHQVLLLVPARSGTVQRWLSDTDEARVEAQEQLAVSLATLATAGIRAEGRVVDEDPVQAIEDIAAQHGASRLVLVAGADQHEGVVAELEQRIDRPLDVLEV